MECLFSVGWCTNVISRHEEDGLSQPIMLEKMAMWDF